MSRAVILVFALMFSPSIALAQQPCTTDARHVVDELYRHILERAADTGSSHWVQQLESGRLTVRDVVREIAKSPEHTQRFFNTESGEGTPYERAVGTMYRHLLGRQADAAGQQQWARLAQRSGPGAVVDQLVNSQEYTNNFGDWTAPGSGGLTYCRPGTVSTNQSATPSPTAANRNMRFRGMDRNGDGVISRSEWRGSDVAFDNQDWNNDGILSGDELDPAITRNNRRFDDRNANLDEFYALDTNNNGRIEPREWKGSVAEFYQLDANNDRVLSPAEMANYNRNNNNDNNRVSGTSGSMIYVDPSQRWTNTGIEVRSGDLIMLDASGTVTLSQNGNDVAGPGGARSGRRAADAPLSSQTAGALIARVGNSEPIFVGNRRSFRAPQNGRLFLGVNDDYLGDNTGSFDVMVTVR
jgi:hypothetical protein